MTETAEGTVVVRPAEGPRDLEPGVWELLKARDLCGLLRWMAKDLGGSGLGAAITVDAANEIDELRRERRALLVVMKEFLERIERARSRESLNDVNDAIDPAFCAAMQAAVKTVEMRVW